MASRVPERSTLCIDTTQPNMPFVIMMMRRGSIAGWRPCGSQRFSYSRFLTIFVCRTRREKAPPLIRGLLGTLAKTGLKQDTGVYGGWLK